MWQAAQVYARPPLGAGARIIDPAAGEGVFLDAALAQGKVPASQVYGIEIDPSLPAAWAHRGPRARFYTGDGLLGEWPGVEPDSFDVVVGNPPFGRLGDIMPQAVEAEWWERFGIWRAGAPGRRGPADSRTLRRFPIELLFAERALQLVKPGGVIAYIMPEGFFANARLQAVRDWVREKAQVLGVVELPEQVFRRPGLNARAAIVFLRRRRRRAERSAALLVGVPPDGALSFEAYLTGVLRGIRRQVRGRRVQFGPGLLLPEERLAGARWDARFWKGRELILRLEGGLPLVSLGDHIQHLTYGPIVTGCRPRHVPGGIRIVRQGDFAETGLVGEGALRVAEGSAYDPPRSRVQRRDLLLPRSGAGALGRNRLAVYLEEEPANIGCFVDLVRLAGINPFYVWLFFKTKPGWQQIRALSNGVGTPNINFAEIHSLRIAAIPSEEQAHIESRYLREVWPLHCRSAEGEEGRCEGERRFKRIVRDLELFLEGRTRTTAACF